LTGRSYYIKALVRSGFGVSLLPEWAIRRESAAGELVEIELREGPMRSVLSLARRRGKYVPAPSAALIKMAREWDWRTVGGFQLKSP
jgi:DNA-binding transcriptional LysR family regulator